MVTVTGRYCGMRRGTVVFSSTRTSIGGAPAAGAAVATGAVKATAIPNRYAGRRHLRRVMSPYRSRGRVPPPEVPVDPHRGGLQLLVEPIAEELLALLVAEEAGEIVLHLLVDDPGAVLAVVDLEAG